MGVALGSLVPKREITWEDLCGKWVAVDAFNTIYQFLSSIRQRDGTPLMDGEGRITSHLSGLFYRNVRMLEAGVQPVYVFDGEAPGMKAEESERRRAVRKKAKEEWKKYLLEGRIEEALAKAKQSSSLTEDIVEESKKLLKLMGIPVVEAPSEGEAQASWMVREGKVWAAGSQDYDVLLFGGERAVRNLTLSGMRTFGGRIRKLELLEMEEVLKALEVTQEELIWLGLLVGTDFNPKGITGIGPKKGLKLVRGAGSFEDALRKGKVEWTFETPPQQIITFFESPPHIDIGELKMGGIQKDGVMEYLVQERGFSEGRIENGMAELIKKTEQKSLRSFFG